MISQPVLVTNRVCSNWADGRPSAVTTGPPSLRDAHFGPAQVDHRLDGDGHARLQAQARSADSEVVHVGGRVHRSSDAVTAEGAHDAAARLERELLDGGPDVAFLEDDPARGHAVADDLVLASAFDRTSRVMSLRPAGAAFLQRARAILS